MASSLSEVSALRFKGLTQYREFWDNFRRGVELVSTGSRSEVTNVVQSGLYLRLRWRLIMQPKDVARPFCFMLLPCFWLGVRLVFGWVWSIIGIRRPCSRCCPGRPRPRKVCSAPD